jgi:hypothetical protein
MKIANGTSTVEQIREHKACSVKKFRQNKARPLRSGQSRPRSIPTVCHPLEPIYPGRGATTSRPFSIAGMRGPLP